jgi:hypothetical protein
MQMHEYVSNSSCIVYFYVSLGPITFHHEEDQLDLVSLPQEPLLLLELEATLGVVEMLLAKDIRVMLNL